jgi:hypothetical protein
MRIMRAWADGGASVPHAVGAQTRTNSGNSKSARAGNVDGGRKAGVPGSSAAGCRTHYDRSGARRRPVARVSV